MDQDQDDLYDEDQFYRESEAIPPAIPKLHRELATSEIPSSSSLDDAATSSNTPLRSRDSNKLEGECYFFFSFDHQQYFISVCKYKQKGGNSRGRCTIHKKKTTVIA